MASGTSMVTFADAEIKMRWREPYITEGLNKKLAGVVPRGIYRGFRLGYNGAPMLVEVLADPDTGDHVAVYETATGVTERFSLRVELTGGDFTLDLTAWPSQTVYIAIYAEYSTLGTTLANIRVYTEAEYAGAVEKDELIILGTVDVPVLGNPILVPSIHANYRTLPWTQLSEGARPWSPLFSNGYFEQTGTIAGITGDLVPNFWFDPDDLAWNITSADALVGQQCLELEALVTTVNTVSIVSDMSLAVTPGKLLRWKFAYKIVKSATAGTVTVAVLFTDGEEPPSGSVVVTLATIDVTAAPGSWVELEGIALMPVGFYALARVTADLPNVQYPTTGAALRFDAIQMWVERDESQVASREAAIHWDQHIARLVMRDAEGWLDPAGTWELLGTSTGLKVQRADADDTHATQPQLSLPGRLVLGRASGLAPNYARVTMDGSDTLADLVFARDVVLNSYAGARSLREYVGLGSQWMYEWTTNARWNTVGSNYLPDSLGLKAFSFQLLSSGIQLNGQEVATNPVNLTDDIFSITFKPKAGSPGYRVPYLDLGYEPRSGTSPVWLVSDYSSLERGLSSRNTCHMWFKCRSDGAGMGVATITIFSGFNVEESAPAPVFSGGGIKVYASSDFLSGFHMSGVANTLSTGRYGTVVVDALGDYLIVYAVDPMTGNIVDLENNSEDLDVIVFGILYS